ncbi:putative holin-like toxin, partial [Staphylococcus aureus]|nr:putative holin-like toxin [Staphylococcus aureus]
MFIVTFIGIVVAIINL